MPPTISLYVYKFTVSQICEVLSQNKCIQIQTTLHTYIRFNLNICKVAVQSNNNNNKIKSN